ncbi:MAG: lamin tail domain-containing protein [Planctomycetota bacterium]
MLRSLLLVSLLAPSSAQRPAGDESDPEGLTIVIVDVGQGSGMVIHTPDGTVHLIDAGNDGQGTSILVPLLRSFQPASYGYTFLTHYHLDHAGGLDEVLTNSTVPFQLCYDRGDTAASGTAYTTYRSAAGSRRRVPSLGQVIQLGGGATLRVLAHNGSVVGGTNVPVAGQNQEENARSLAMRLDYGDFSMWVAGDLTGGGSSTPDVEGPAALACGDVDVYVCDHHGSVTGTSANLWARLSPDVAFASNGGDNSYGHPHWETMDMVNAASRCVPLINTTVGARKYGYGVSRGNVVIKTDGRRYRVSTPALGALDFFVDEDNGHAPAPGDLVISELHRDPNAVIDSSGEYVELTNVGGAPVSMRGLRLSTASGVVTFGANLALYPGRPLVFAADGDDSRNGGLPIGVTLPNTRPSRFAWLGDGTDTVVLRNGASALDSVSYTAGFPGGPGVAAERRDLLAPGTAANFVGAFLTYGNGDRGSPGRRNLGDLTQAPGRMVVESGLGSVTLRASAISDGGSFSIVGLAFGNTGFPFLGGHIPLDLDQLFLTTTNLPGFVALLPSEGYRSVTLALPNPNPLAGLRAYAAHIAMNLAAPSLRAVSTAAPFVFQ